MKRRTFRKIAAVFAAASLLFTACGTGGGSTNADGSAKLTWYVATTPQADQEAVFEAANKIIKEKLGYTVDFILIDGGSYQDKMNAMIGAGEEFDICFTSSWLNNYKNNVQNEAFIALDDYNGENLLEKYAPTLYKTVPENIWEGTKVNGHIYGVVNYQICTSGKAYWLRKDLVEKYNFDYTAIKSWKDIEPFLQTIKENEPDIYPLETNRMWGVVESNLGFIGGDIGGTGYRYKENDQEVAADKIEFINEYATPEFKEYLNTMKAWYDKGYVREDVSTVTDTTNDLKLGKYAVGYEGNVKPGMEAEYKNKYGHEVVTATVSDITLGTGTIIATLNAISSTSKHPVEAMKVMELVNTDPELFNLISHGIEGKHWEKDAENSKDGVQYIKMLDSDKYSVADWMLGNVMNGYLIEGQEPDVWEQTQKLNEEAKPQPLLGFSFDMTPVQDQVSNVDAVTGELLPPLEYGMVDVDSQLSDMLKKMENAGINDILAEMNKQVAEWRANQ